MFAVIFVNLLGATVAASIQSIISGAADARSQGQALGAVGGLNSLMAVIAPRHRRAAADDGVAPAGGRLAHRHAVLFLRRAAGRGAGPGGSSLPPPALILKAHQRPGDRHGITDRRRSPQFHRADHRGADRFPQVDRRQVGGAVLAPQGLHPGVHHRARHDGAHEGRVRQAQREDHRPVVRPGGRPQALGEGHRGDAGRGGQLPDDRRRRPEGGEALRHASRRGRRPASAPRRKTPPCAPSSSSARTRRSS